MSQAKKVVFSFLNSAEGYFHTRRILQNQVKQPRDLYGPMSNRPERWNYTDIRDINKYDLDLIINTALNNVDRELFAKIPKVALNAALQYTIHTLDYGKYQSKIDANAYNFLLNILKMKTGIHGV